MAVEGAVHAHAQVCLVGPLLGRRYGGVVVVLAPFHVLVGRFYRAEG